MAAPFPDPNKPFPIRGEERLPPIEYGGHSKLFTSPEPLFERAFDARTPPSLPLNSIIVAICGITDHEDDASPKNSGFILSDFYLFHHLFKGAPNEQHWLTCIRPQHLVAKYEELLHGHPRTERRVVLDKYMLGETIDIAFIPRRDLGARFLAYVERAGQATKDTERQVFVMMFGHGEANFSISIGGEGHPDFNYRIGPENLRRALRKYNQNVKASLLTTSCFGGGWCFATSGNITALAGCSPKKEILSWPKSASIGRLSGTKFATSVAEALCRSDFANCEDEEGIKELPTFAALTKCIHDILKYEIDVSEVWTRPSFAAKDDLWGSDYRAQSGFTLESIKDRYESLRTIPIGRTAQGSPSASGSVILGDVDIFKRESVLCLADWYMRSRPGHDLAANNVAIHNSISRLRNPRGRPLNDELIDSLKNKLNYRISMTKLATSYKNYMQISFMDCQDLDARMEYYKLSDSEDKEQVKQVEKCYQLVMGVSSELFERPRISQGPHFGQLIPYLTIALHSTNWTTDEMDAALTKCKKYKEETWNVRRVITPLALMKHPAVQEMISQLKNKRPRDIDSDSVSVTPARKYRVPREHLRGKDDQLITTPSPQSRGSLEGFFDDSQGYYPSRRSRSESPTPKSRLSEISVIKRGRARSEHGGSPI